MTVPGMGERRGTNRQMKPLPSFSSTLPPSAPSVTRPLSLCLSVPTERRAFSLPLRRMGDEFGPFPKLCCHVIKRSFEAEVEKTKEVTAGNCLVSKHIFWLRGVSTPIK